MMRLISLLEQVLLILCGPLELVHLAIMDLMLVPAVVDFFAGEKTQTTNTSLACPGSLTPLPNAWVPDGFCASVWTTGLTGPRGIIAVSNRDLLVIESLTGRISALWDDNNDGRSDTSERAIIAAASGLNHAIALHGEFLYASTSRTVFRWKYVPGQRSNLGPSQTVVVNVPCCGHNTRTLAFDPNGLLYVSVGSSSNVDSDSTHARIHQFDLGTAPSLPMDWNDGNIFADGLRNEIGLTFDRDGVLWGVENGVDNLNRGDLGGDIHNDNPSEEVNKFVTPGRFYGYPYCWSEYILPQFGLGRGTQWVQPQFMGQYTDAWCRNPNNVVVPAWSLAAHQAPLDIQFYYGSSLPSSYFGGAFVPLHGSWNRNPPQGYRVNFIAIQNGIAVREEVLLRNIGNAHNWPNGVRPVALANTACRDGAGDTNDCLFLTSDATGQVIKIGYYN